MEDKQAKEALRRYADRLDVLNQVGRAILAAQTPEEIAAVALSHLQRLIPFLRASVTLFDVQAGEMSLLAVHPAASDFEPTWRHPLEEKEFLAKLAVGQVHLAEDPGEWASPLPLAKMLQTQGVRAYAHVPLLVQDALIGSLNLGMAAPGMLGEPEIEIAREIADELAIGIQQTHLLAQVKRHAEELEQQVRRRTAALRASQARFQAVFEDSALGIALVNRKGQVIDSNPALQEMMGYSQDELEGMVFARLAHPDNLRDDADLYDELMAGERAFYRLEGRYLRKDGQPIHANLTVSLVRPTRGRPRFAVALVEDVTDQKRAQTALIEAEKLALTGRLAASLAHEINNPMQSVIGYLSLIEESLPDRADAREYLEIALEELERAAGIVARMRDLSRPSDPGERERVDVNALVERVLLLTQKQCQNQHIEVQWVAAEDLPLLSLAPDRMQQVFLNLVLNAVDAIAGISAEAAADGGRLRVCTARTPETPGVQIVFADNGVGIPPDEQRYLFEPFHTTKEVGLGLGLYISQRIVQDHGGRIEVASQEGAGTTFTVWLPCQEPAGEGFSG